MKKYWIVLAAVGACMLLTGCVSGKRMMRNSPFNSSGKFYRSGVNLWPVYYQEGVNKSILFPLIDIDDRGFAVRPLYHRDNDEHGILWPLCAFNKDEGWAGTFMWTKSGGYGLLPLFYNDDEFLWVFPASWYDKANNSYAILPLLAKDGEFLWVGNVIKDKDMFLVFPFYGQGKNWFYFLNFIYHTNKKRQENTYVVPPLAWYQHDEHGNMLLTPLFSYSYRRNDLQMLNIAMLLYHYSYGKHHFFYPFADIDWAETYQQCWLWPVFNYGRYTSNDTPFFLFSYDIIGSGRKEDLETHRLRILYPLLFEHKYRKDYTKTKILMGLLWNSYFDKDDYDCNLLYGALFRNSRDEKSRRFSLLYKLFSYHRYNEDVKIEFFPFVKIMQTSAGDSWSFCWRLLEKHDGGGHIFFIPWGDPAPEYGKIDD